MNIDKEERQKYEKEIKNITEANKDYNEYKHQLKEALTNANTEKRLIEGKLMQQIETIELQEDQIRELDSTIAQNFRTINIYLEYLEGE